MKKGLKLLALWPLVTGLSGCDSNKIYTKTVYAFSTFLEMKISAKDEKIINQAESMISYFSEITDSYEKSDQYVGVYDVNHTNEKIEVSKELYYILYLADCMKEETNGNFSPYLFNLSVLYKNDFAINAVPSSSEIEPLLAEANETNLMFFKEDEAYYVQRNGTGQIDLGGIAKGACLDALHSLLEENGITYYLVSSQSSILMGEKDYSPSYFKIAIRDKPNCLLKLQNCGLATSSISEQRYDIDGITYSHIIDPKTGSAEAKRTAAIVKGGLDENAKLDAYATAFMNMEDNEIKDFVEKRSLSSLIINGSDSVSYNLDTYVI